MAAGCCRCELRSRDCAFGLRALFAALLLLSRTRPCRQKPSQPGFDPRQTEKRFDAPQSGQTPSADRAVADAAFCPAGTHGDSKPLFVLRGVSLTGAHAIPRDQFITAYQPYLGKTVSQADLAAIAAAVSDLYRAAGFHLSRAIVPPQDIQDGPVRASRLSKAASRKWC